MRYYQILNTEENKAKGFGFGYTETRPPEGVDFHEMKLVNGIEYHEETPDEVVGIIEACRRSNRSYRLKFDWGNAETGQSWGEQFDTVGYIGKSTGARPIPLLIHNSRSLCGGSLMDNCIVAITMARGGQVLWQHPNYKPRTN